MENKKEVNQNIIMNEENLKKKFLLIFSFENLFDLFKENNYKKKELFEEFKNFCFESEKNDFLCIKNEENLRPEENGIFCKFILCKNRFDFQIYMSDLLIQYIKFLNVTKAPDKIYNTIFKDILNMFSQLNEFLMKDIQCLIEYGLFKEYEHNFVNFLFYLNNSNIKSVLEFFDIKKYLLTNNNITNFISKFNENINAYSKQEKKSMTFGKKIEIILSELLNNILVIDKKIESEEIKNKIIKIKDLIIKDINKNQIFDILKQCDNFDSHFDVVLGLFKIFKDIIEKQIILWISNGDKKFKKQISKFLIKNASWIDDYINTNILYDLNNFSINNAFDFYISQYKQGKKRLINMYHMFEDNEIILKKLVEILREDKKEKQANLIEKKNYTEKDEYELEEIPQNNGDKFFELPKNFQIFYISCENEKYYNESKRILEKFNDSTLVIDEFLGIDSEWKNLKTFLDNYTDNLISTNKNYNLVKKINKFNLSNIIQISGKDFGFIFDTKSIIINDEIKNKIEKLFSKCKFIGFEFSNDFKKIGEFFKKIVTKNNFIELGNIYTKIKNKKCPELKLITTEIFGKVLDKRDQLSDWSKRPLLSSQLKYAILDAYVLVLIYNKLKQNDN